jgi:hypothetical protein
MALVRLKTRYIKETSLTPAGSNPLADILVIKEAMPSTLDRFSGAVRKAFGALAPKDSASHPQVAAALDEMESALKEQAAALAQDDSNGVELPDSLISAVAGLHGAVKAMEQCKDCTKGKPCKTHGAAYKEARLAVRKEYDAVSTTEAYAQSDFYKQVDALTSSLYSISYDDEIKDKAAAYQQTFKQFLELVASSQGEPITKEPNMPAPTPAAAQTPPATDASKDIPAHIAKQMADMQATIDAQKERSDKAEKELAEMREKEQRRELLTVAKEIRGDITGATDDEVADVLKQLDDAGRTTIRKLLTAAKEAINTGALFGENGSARGPHEAAGAVDAHKQLQEKAAVIQKENPAMKRSDALLQAMKENPQLKAQAEGTTDTQ